MIDEQLLECSVVKLEIDVVTIGFLCQDSL